MPRSLFSKQLFGHALAGCAGIPISDADARFPYQVSWRADENNPRRDALRGGPQKRRAAHRGEGLERPAAIPWQLHFSTHHDSLPTFASGRENTR